MPNLERELQALADRRSAESTTDFDAVLTTVRSRRHRRTATWSAAAAVVAVAAVITLTPWNHPDTAPAPATTKSVDPSRVPAKPIVLEPSVAVPGQEVAARFPDGRYRGAYLYVARADEPEKPLYILRTRHPTEPQAEVPRWWKAGEEGGMIYLLRFGHGPDILTVPPIIAAGRYVVCTDPIPSSQTCGLLTVRR
jgi:hypothetical protein